MVAQLGINMEIVWFRFPLECGLNFIKVRYQRNPNEEWSKGFGVSLCNVGFCIHWKRK